MDFWAEQGLDSPLGKTWPRVGEDLSLSGGESFDVYDDGCGKSPKLPTAPGFARIFSALVRKLTRR